MPLTLTFAAFVVSLAALWAGRNLAIRFGFADKPGGRKRHETPVPPMGGLVILPVFLVFTQLAHLTVAVPPQLIAGVLALLIMGAVDDAVSVKPWIKFVLMVLTACFVVTFGQAQIGNLGNLFGFGTVELGWLSKGFTIMCLVLLMNSINMMDGVDGLAGGFCAIMTSVLMFYCVSAGLWPWFWALAILLATLLAFLWYNMRHPLRKSAVIFMGDAGALCLGLVLGWFAIHLTQMRIPHAPIAPVAVIWVIALPVMDAFSLFIVRSLRGFHPFNADRRHFHHRLLDAGFSPARTTLIMLGIVVVLSAIGIAGQFFGVPPVILFALWMVLFIFHVAASSHPRGYTLLTRLLRSRLRKISP